MRSVLVLFLAGLVVRAGSGNVAGRLEEIAELRRSKPADAERRLLDALSDRDWEVVDRAAEALGELGGPASLDPLVSLALHGPVRRIRLAAAASLARIDREGAAARLAKRLRGKTALAACDALELVPHPVAAKDLERLLRNKDGALREASLAALGALGDAGRVDSFAKYLTDPDIRVRAAAVGALVRTGTKRAVGPLREGLKAASMTSVMERRHIAGIRQILAGLKYRAARDFAATMCTRSMGSAGNAAAEARLARLFGSLGRKSEPVGPGKEYLRVLTGVGLSHGDPEVRAASVAALGRIGRDESFEKVAGVAQGDPSARVRFHAMRAGVAIRPKRAEALVIARLQYDKDPMVREEAAVLCYRQRYLRAGPLIRALRDSAWEVSVSAAVSLGKLHLSESVAPLRAMYGEKDWRRRGGAVAGLGWCKQKGAVSYLIDALRDKEPAVAATAREFLRHLSGERLEGTPKLWRRWWTTQEKVFVFRDRDKEAREKKKYGYATQPRKVYEDLDIVVLQTRRGGDNIQLLLDEYDIEHRIVRAASIAKVGLHPFALFVANCPGEINDKDAERLQWFVRAGGYLFASCWALTHTVQRCFPDVVRKLETRAQVLDVVEAARCPSHSPFIEGVFDGVTKPYYMLEGSHLIEVLDPERFEVLIDSPECATRWGDGNLAGWFTIGHGTILDSANHFDLQGMARAKVKSEKDRMAFAMDHLGYDYAELRKLAAERVFSRQPTAVKKTRDLSIFRFITTFVREKRIADEE